MNFLLQHVFPTLLPINNLETRWNSLPVNLLWWKVGQKLRLCSGKDLPGRSNGLPEPYAVIPVCYKSPALLKDSVSFNIQRLADESSHRHLNTVSEPLQASRQWWAWATELLYVQTTQSAEDI